MLRVYPGMRFVCLFVCSLVLSSRFFDSRFCGSAVLRFTVARFCVLCGSILQSKIQNLLNLVFSPSVIFNLQSSSPPEAPMHFPLTEWQRRHDADPPDAWRPAVVPGAWERDGVPFTEAGPFWYRTTFTTPQFPPGARLWLSCAAVSYHCALFLNGIPIGEHTGMWDSFQIELAGLTPGAPAELLLRIEKPASLTAGPDSPSLPGRFALRETLAGFLPYVWGHAFGGVWQPVELIITGPTIIEDLWIDARADGLLTAEALCSAPAEVVIDIFDPQGRLVITLTAAATLADLPQEERTWSAARSAVPDASSAPTGDPAAAPHAWLAHATASIPAPQCWSPSSPARYTAVARIAGDTAGEPVHLRFGFRSIAIDGAALLLNSRPIYPRMALSWGWYPEHLAPDPGPERVRADMLRLRELGYNGIKLCLWAPPSYYFDIADELGMLLWLELPLWIPRVTPFLRRQLAAEYPRIVRQARNHPALIMYSLGCELNRAVGPDILGPLYTRVKALSGGLPLRDNSGSGAAYGGLLDEFADYRDYHFYADPHFLRPLIDHFSPAWRDPQPWLFGEFCDYDTLSVESSMVKVERPTAQPVQNNDQDSTLTLQPSTRNWWLSPSPAINPQGARWQYDIQHHAARLAATGLAERVDELRALSARQGLLHRKLTLEYTRAYPQIAGYVVTGEADTPISSAGMWYHDGSLKFEPAEFRAFNADLVALIGYESRRDWVAGGDRPARADPWSCSAGAPCRAHLIAAHHGASAGPASVAWSATLANGAPIAQGEFSGPAVAPGSIRAVGVAEFLAPELTTPQRIDLRCRIVIGDDAAENEWPIWCFPRDPWRSVERVALLDPSGRLSDLARHAPALTTIAPHQLIDARGVLIATAWSRALAAFIARGGRAVVLIDGDEAAPYPSRPAPFWRECVRIVAPHPAWGDFPHEGFAGLQFYAFAADHLLDTTDATGAIPILQRLDTRTMALHDYVVEHPIGSGRAIITTLRLHGGIGDQPDGIMRSPAASYLLRCWVAYLRGML
jgi:hypothetical protein